MIVIDHKLIFGNAMMNQFMSLPIDLQLSVAEKLREYTGGGHSLYKPGKLLLFAEYCNGDCIILARKDMNHTTLASIMARLW